MIDPRFHTLKPGGFSLSELCSRLGFTSPDGSFGETLITHPAALAGSKPGSISFLESKRHVASLDTAKASACFVKEAQAEAVAALNIVPVICDAPKYQLAKATALLVQEADNKPEIAQDASIHPSALIGPGVKIGSGVSVGPNSVITHSIIGEGAQIGACTVIGGTGFGVAIGSDGSVLSVPHVGRVVIGRDVRIGSNTCIDRGQLGDTEIHDNCQIDNLVQIGHNSIIECGCILAGRVGISGSCHLGEGVMMGGSAGLADHINIGAGARLAAFAGVMHDVPAGETWSGIPAMPIRDHMRIVAKAKRDIRKSRISFLKETALPRFSHTLHQHCSLTVFSLFDGRRTHAQVYVSPDWDVFRGHFPGRPILPGVLMIEMVAQTGALIGILGGMVEDGAFLAFTGIDKARFRRPVKPGETLDLYAELIEVRRSIYRFKGSAECDGQRALTVEFLASPLTFEG